MTFDQLVYFISIVECGHMTKAAEKLHVTQSTLSLSMKKLEEELGVELFKMQGRNLILVPAGELFYDGAIKIVREVRTLKRDVQTLVRQLPHSISIVSNAVDITTEALPILQATYPQLQIVHIRSLNYKDSFRRIEKGSAEMLVTTIPVVQSSLRCEELFQDPLLVAVPENHAFRWCSSVSLQEFSEETFITIHMDSANRTIHEKIFQRAHVQPKHIYEVGDPENTYLATAMGMGISLFPSLLKKSLDNKITRLRSADNVFMVPVQEPFCKRSVYLVYDQNRLQEPYQQEVLSFFRKYMKLASRLGHFPRHEDFD